MDKKYLTVGDVSKTLNIGKSTLYSYVNKRQIPCLKISGKVLFEKTDLEDWILSKKQPVIN
jgi:excisionase family DNA binding protein